jgi:hypothetical protein
MQFQFDARTVEPNLAFEPLPAGWYTAMITASEGKQTADAQGSYLEVALEIMGGDFNKRKVFDRLNLVNKNPMAVDIAYRTLSAICHATGVLQMNASEDLHGKPMLIKVTFRAARTDPMTGKSYDASNEVKGYKAVDPNAPPVLGPPKSAQVGMTVAQGAVMGNGGQPAWLNTQAQAVPQQPAPVQQAPAGWGQAPQQAQPQYAPQPEQAAAPPAWAQPQQPQQYAPAQGFQQAPQQPANTAPMTQPNAGQAIPNAVAGNFQGQPQQPAQGQLSVNGGQPWAGQPQAQQAQPPAQPAAQPATAQGQPPAQGPGGTPPWAQGGQPGAQAPTAPPWQK